MKFIDDLTAKLPFGKAPAEAEKFFAVNIGQEKLTACLWSVETGQLSISNSTSIKFDPNGNLIDVIDQLLDETLGPTSAEPEKILFGVPDSWLLDDDLKPAYLKILRDIVKTLEITPMAYVATSHAIAHLIENQEGAPTTAILVGMGQEEAEVTVIRAGKVDGTKVVKRADVLGGEIEKALIGFTEVEVLPSRILIYGEGDLEKQKATLLSFPWMNRLSFLHFPKIESLEDSIAIKSISLAGATELNPNVKYIPAVVNTINRKSSLLESVPTEKAPIEEGDNFGFVAGDIAENVEKDLPEELPEEEDTAMFAPRELDTPPSPLAKMEQEVEQVENYVERKLPFKIPEFRFAGGKIKFLIPVVVLVLLVGVYMTFAKATVTIFVEPKVLEKDTQVTADPGIKTIDEANKKIPGQIVETSESGSDKAQATGKKQVGDAAKGTVKVINNSDSPQTLSQGTTITSNNLKFTLDSSVNIASTSATSDSKSTGTVSVTASSIGADGNLPSGTQFSSSNSKVAIVAEGNFSGGTSRDVTVVSDEDQKRLLASLAATLRKKASDDLSGKLDGKKILEEALSEEITKKSYNKNINDQASEFTLNLTVRYKGTAYSDDDLKSIVSKLVGTDVPEGFELNLAETETQADVSKLEKDGKLIFLARFSAKLTPKIDQEKIRSQIKGKTLTQAADIIKSYENVLSSEIKLTPQLPSTISHIPFWGKNISIEVRLK
jgi:hypothetical protein